MVNRILKYTLSGLIPYFIIRKFFPEKSKVIDEEEKKNLRVRGGDSVVVLHWLKLLMKDRAIRAAVAGIFSTAILTEFNDAILEGLIQSSPSILAAPGDKKKLFLSKKVRNI